jgi:ketosteroid isomerase-like protein
MSQENVEVVKTAYEVFARGGLDRFMEHFTDDVEYRVLAGAPDDPGPGPLHGKDAVRAWLQDWIDMFDGFWMKLVELIDAGEDTVVALERFGGRAGLSGVETDFAQLDGLHHPRREDRSRPRVRDPRGNPRSRRVAGVGRSLPSAISLS